MLAKATSICITCSHLQDQMLLSLHVASVSRFSDLVSPAVRMCREDLKYLSFACSNPGGQPILSIGFNHHSQSNTVWFIVNVTRPVLECRKGGCSRRGLKLSNRISFAIGIAHPLRSANQSRQLQWRPQYVQSFSPAMVMERWQCAVLSTCHTDPAGELFTSARHANPSRPAYRCPKARLGCPAPEARPPWQHRSVPPDLQEAP